MSNTRSTRGAAAGGSGRWSERIVSHGSEKRAPRFPISRRTMARFILSLFLAVFVFWLQHTDLGRKSFLALIERSLFDHAVQLRQNAVGGAAPPVAVVNFDDASRATYFGARMSGATVFEWPTQTPLDVVRRVMALSREAGAVAILVDIDIVPAGSQRTDLELAEFAVFLAQWAADPDAPIAVFARSTVDVTDEAGERPLALLAPSPFDTLFADAPNLAWGSGQAFRDSDGVVRSVATFICVSVGGTEAPLGHMGLYAAAAAADRAPGAAKKEVQRALRDGKLCGPGSDSEAFSIALGRSRMAFEDREGLVPFHFNLAGLGDEQPFGRSTAPLPVAEGWGRPGARAAIGVPAGALFEEDMSFPMATGAIVVLASSNGAFRDIHVTPYGWSPGAMVVANYARGLSLAGPLRPLSWPLQALILVSIVILLNLYYVAMERAHFGLSMQETQRRGFLVGVWRMLTSPVASKVIVTGLIYGGSIVVGWVLLEYGRWDAIATPSLAASLILAMDDSLSSVIETLKRGAGRQ